MANSKSQSKANSKSANRKPPSRKPRESRSKVVVPEPSLLLLGHEPLDGAAVRFEHVQVGTPFEYLQSVFLKVGKTSALCLMANSPENVRKLIVVTGAKVVLAKSAKVKLSTVDLCIKLKGVQAAPTAAPSVHVTSDIAAAVLDRA